MQRQKRAKLATACSGEKDREERLTDAVRQVLCIPAGQPVTYKSPDQKRALEAVIQGSSLVLVVLPTGGGKTLVPLAAAVLDNQQQPHLPNITLLILPFHALIEDMLIRLAKARISAAK